DDGIGAGEIDILENTRGMRRSRSALVRIKPAVLVDENRLSRGNISYSRESQHIERHAFRSKHVFGALYGIALSQNERANTVRIAEAEQPVTDDHGHDGVPAAHAPIDG